MKNLSAIAKLLGRRGGQKTLETHGPRHFKNISKKGLQSRWGKPKEPKEKI